MKLREVLKYLSFCENVVVYQDDFFTDNRKPEIIYRGYISDIPCYIGEMYLSLDAEGEPIGICQGSFEIYVREK